MSVRNRAVVDGGLRASVSNSGPVSSERVLNGWERPPFVNGPADAEPGRVGYARISRGDHQSLDMQVEALRRAGCSRIYQDELSGGRDDRPGLEAALGFLRTGDQLTVWKLDRLSRSLAHLIRLSRELDERGIGLRSLHDQIDTGSAMGRFFFHVMGALAELERGIIRERTLAGLEEARRKGHKAGRPVVMTAERRAMAREMLGRGWNYTQIARALKVSRVSVSRWARAVEQD